MPLEKSMDCFISKHQSWNLWDKAFPPIKPVVHYTCNIGMSGLPDIFTLVPQWIYQVDHSCPCYNYKKFYNCTAALGNITTYKNR